MKKVIATDLDGTLFYPKKRMKMIPKKNIQFLRHFIEEGGHVLLVTGRNLPYTNKVVEKIGYSLDVIGCNAGFIKVGDEFIRKMFLPQAQISQVLEDAQQKFGCNYYTLMSEDQSLVLGGKKANWLVSLIYRLVYKFQGVYAEKYVISNETFKEEIEKGRVYKMMLFFGLGRKGRNRACEANKYIRKTYPHVEASWADSFIELTASGATKAEGIKEYCKRMNIDCDDVIVVGDSGNDISMFNAFENSFCMKHASKKVKKYAKYHIDMVADLEKFVFEKGEMKNE